MKEETLNNILEVVNDENINHVDLDVSTWQGISFDAEHYYGKLIFWGENSKILIQVELERQFGISEAKRLDKKDDAMGMNVRRFKRGDNWTNRYNEEINVIADALQLCRKVSSKIKFGFKLRMNI